MSGNNCADLLSFSEKNRIYQMASALIRIRKSTFIIILNLESLVLSCVNAVIPFSPLSDHNQIVDPPSIEHYHLYVPCIARTLLLPFIQMPYKSIKGKTTSVIMKT